MDAAWPCLVDQMRKNPPAMWEIWVWSLGGEDSPGGGNGNPLQYSCLGNPVDRRAWWATVHGIARIGQDWTTKQQQCVESTKAGWLWLNILLPLPVYNQKATFAYNLQGFAENVCKPQYQTSLRPPGYSNSPLNVPSIPLGYTQVGPTKHSKS